MAGPRGCGAFAGRSYGAMKPLFTHGVSLRLSPALLCVMLRTAMLLPLGQIALTRYIGPSPETASGRFAGCTVNASPPSGLRSGANMVALKVAQAGLYASDLGTAWTCA